MAIAYPHKYQQGQVTEYSFPIMDGIDYMFGEPGKFRVKYTIRANGDQQYVDLFRHPGGHNGLVACP